MTKALSAVAAALLFAFAADASAASQMHKCVEGGRTMYQQAPCNPPPEPAASTASPSAAASAASAAAAKNLRRPSPASSAPATPR